MSLWSKRDGIALPGFNGTNVWFAPNAPINSSEAFHHATNLEEGAYLANRYMFVALMIVMSFFIAHNLPHVVVRMRWTPRWYWGWRLSRSKLGNYPGTSARPPHRLARVNLRFIPVYRVPWINMPLSEFLLVLFLWLVCLGIAGWCQSAFLTDASRSTLVVMQLASFTAALGVKSGGVGTWVACSYTAVNYLHRWTGRIVLLLATLHVVAYLVVFYQAGIVKQEMAKSENYLGALGFAGLCLTGVMSIRPIRRSKWLFFKFGHHLGILLLLAGLNYHSPDVVPYLLAMWILLFIDALCRSSSVRIVTSTLTALPGSKTTLVHLPGVNRSFIPGQHVRLRCLSGMGMGWRSWLESHPFTIASAEGEEGVELYVKAAGDWTAKLYEAAQSGPPVRFSVEGPYGGPLNFLFPAFGSVLLVAGGSGISFALGTARGLLADLSQGRSSCKRLTLAWIVKDHDSIDDLAQQFLGLLQDASKLSLADPDLRVRIPLHYTRSIKITPDREKLAENTVLETDDVDCLTSTVSPVDTEKRPRGDQLAVHNRHSATQALALWSNADISVDIMKGRPDLAALVQEFVATSADGKGLGIGACGPDQLVYELEDLTRRVGKAERDRLSGVEIHCERFSL